MKSYFVPLLVTALAISFVIIRKSQAQNASSQPMDTTGDMMANAVGANTNNPPTPGSGAASQESPPIFVTDIPPGYRDWKLISVAHEEGKLNDIRAILGNDIAIKAYRDGTLPFPDGAIIARIAWSYVPSEENNKIFGRVQSFVPGPPPDWYLQFEVKDSKKFAASGGWGFGQFDKDGKPAGEAMMTSCFPCHQAIKSRNFIFTRYAP